MNGFTIDCTTLWFATLWASVIVLVMRWSIIVRHGWLLVIPLIALRTVFVLAKNKRAHKEMNALYSTRIL